MNCNTYEVNTANCLDCDSSYNDNGVCTDYTEDPNCVEFDPISDNCL